MKNNANRSQPKEGKRSEQSRRERIEDNLKRIRRTRLAFSRR
ncbi:MAG: hypothetical protein AAGN35_07230 [Bacteroidota bacterium]